MAHLVRGKSAWDELRAVARHAALVAVGLTDLASFEPWNDVLYGDVDPVPLVDALVRDQLGAEDGEAIEDLVEAIGHSHYLVSGEQYGRCGFEEQHAAAEALAGAAYTDPLPGACVPCTAGRTPTRAAAPAPRCSPCATSRGAPGTTQRPGATCMPGWSTDAADAAGPCPRAVHR